MEWETRYSKNKLQEIKHLEGRTIEKATEDSGAFLLRFTDGKWACFQAVLSEDYEEAYTKFPGYPIPQALLRAGIITEKKFEEIVNERQGRYEKEQREEYERLKAKFEPQATST